MTFASLGRSFERKLLRPVFRRLKRSLRTTEVDDRIGRLESRIEELERLFREQAGLHYLRFAAEMEPETAGQEPAPARRSA